LAFSQDGSSEEFIGEWAEKRGIRDQLVIATKVCAICCRLCFLHYPDPDTYIKYTMNYKREQSDISHKVNYIGNHAKSLHISIRDSLKKLRTSYVDILYVHFWEYSTSVEEVMDALHVLVIQGKLLYLVRVVSHPAALFLSLIASAGNLRGTGVGGGQGKSIREISWKIAFCDLSRPVVCL
jgi:aryl-alcohol dehydrogenase-like predicted oxidoreductase